MSQDRPATKVAALYDIHGNLPALEAVLADVRAAGVERVVVGGDVMPGPQPRECLDLLRDCGLPVDYLHGNGETAVLACLAGDEPTSVPEPARPAVRWVAERLRPEDERSISDWPPTQRLSTPVGEVLFCHATPRSDTEIFTRRTPEAPLLPIFRDLDVSLVVCGHTHMPFDRKIGDTRVVNAGSVGMPFGTTGACWLLLERTVIPRHTAYDLSAAAERIRATPYPQAEIFVERNVLSAPSESDMLALFAKAEIGSPGAKP